VNHDDRLSRYLTDQADALTLPPGDAAATMRRGARRRTRRRAGFVGGLAVVAVLGATLAVRDPGTDQQVDVNVSSSVAVSSFDWEAVVPTSGLGYGDRTAQTADGTLFGISTAPGPYDDGDPEASLASTLYRSTDGAEWTAASLPSGMRTADLAGAGDTLYGLGTSPAGGLVLASSTDGAASWSSVDLPGDVAALDARHGDKLLLGPAALAATDASHLVATIVVTTSTELGAYLPDVTGEDHTWTWDDTGVSVYELEKVPCDEGSGVIVDRKADGDPEAARSADMECRVAPAEGEGTEVGRYTYEELGIVGELRDHLGGKAYTYVSEDGRTFERVEVPGAAGTAASTLVAATPIATTDGYRLVLGTAGPDGGSTSVLGSADGRTWEHAASIDGYAAGTGIVDGRPAVAVYDRQDRSIVRIEQADGTWSEVDLGAAVATPEGSSSWVGPIAFGPLGAAAVVQTGDDDGGSVVQHLVHTRDGSTLEVLPVADVLEDAGGVAGLVVTPDAIVARFVQADDQDPGTPARQEVLVGTPG
jgi:hypothetical protein